MINMLIMENDLPKIELSRWCEYAYAEYKRRYTERSGMFTPAKYYASLLALFSKKILSLEKSAEIAGCTYGSLRVWRSGKGFKKQVQENVEQFSTFYISRANQLVKNGKFFEPSPGMGFRFPSKARIALAKELAYYSCDLQKFIIVALRDEAAKEFHQGEPSIKYYEIEAFLSLIIKTTEGVLIEIGELKTAHMINLLSISKQYSLQIHMLETISELIKVGMPIDENLKSTLGYSRYISERLERALKEAESL